MDMSLYQNITYARYIVFWLLFQIELFCSSYSLALDQVLPVVYLNFPISLYFRRAQYVVGVKDRRP